MADFKLKYTASEINEKLGQIIDKSTIVKSVNGTTPDEEGNVELETVNDTEYTDLVNFLVEQDMLFAVEEDDGGILVDENENILIM